MPGLETSIVCVSAVADVPYWIRKPARFVIVEPSVLVVGAAHDSVALPLAGAVTVIENGASESVSLVSLTEITMLEYTPAAAACGVPVKRPVLLLKVAQLGMFWMLYVSVSLSASEAVGWKVYAEPAVTLVGGVPEMTGALFAAALTVIVNGPSESLASRSSVTVMTMPLNVP